MGLTDRPDDRRVAGSWLPPTANLLSKGITKRLNPESQNARKSRPAPVFLAKLNTCQRQITAINQQLPNTSRTTDYSRAQAIFLKAPAMKSLRKQLSRYRRDVWRLSFVRALFAEWCFSRQGSAILA